MTLKSSTEIREILDDLSRRKIEIDGQIADAKRAFAAGGPPADIDWLRRAEHAQKMTGRDIQYWQGELGKARKAERQASAKQHEARFIQCARQMLPAETFNAIMQSAQTQAGIE